MTEKLGSQPSPDKNKRHIDTLPLDSPELRFLYNYLDFAFITDASCRDDAFRRLQIEYGIDNVRRDLAVIDGKHVANPHIFGIYVDANRWAELHPVQESPQEPTPSV